MFKYLAVVVSFLMLVESECKSWHTSQVVLKELYNLQKEHINVINEYLDKESKRVIKLKNDLVATQEWLNPNVTKTNVHQYNHINAIKLLKRIHDIKSKMENCMDNKQSTEDTFNKIDEEKEISDLQLLHAHRGLRRLQRFYKIPASDMAAGRYGDRIIGDQLVLWECYAITENCFRENDMYGATDWAILTYYKWLNNGRPMFVDVNKLNYYLVLSSVYTGMNFISLTNSNSHNHSENTENFARHYFLMSKEIPYGRDKRKPLDIFDAYYSIQFAFSESKFKDLCKHGKSNRILTNESMCRYQTKNSSYRILMPFKEEDVYNNDPIIKIYHDVVNDIDIKEMKTMGLPSMDDAQIKDMEGKSITFELTRSNQVGWIENRLTEGHLDARIADFTGLYTKSSIYYQLANYGLGGFYNPHYDSFPRNIVLNEFGNRLVTVLLYLTDVQNGGHTVFPNLGIVSPAEKGAALVWYNINPSNGIRYEDSVHGACPILKGNKWILTRWLAEEGQSSLTYNWKNISIVKRSR